MAALDAQHNGSNRAPQVCMTLLDFELRAVEVKTSGLDRECECKQMCDEFLSFLFAKSHKSHCGSALKSLFKITRRALSISCADSR